MSDVMLRMMPVKGAYPYFGPEEDENIWPGTEIPPRKAPFALPSGHRWHNRIEIEYHNGVNAKAFYRRKVEVAATEQHAEQPIASRVDKRRLVAVFAVGVVVFLLGLMILASTLIIKTASLPIVAAVFLVVGSVTIALALLRGQDIDGHGH